jgi:glutaminyl-peptide cyclotransferase
LVPLLLSSCQDKTVETSARDPSEAALPPAPAFNADSAYAFTARQVAFGPRVPNSKAHQACGNYLVARLQAYGLTVREQPFQALTFTGVTIRARNLIAQYHPQAARRIAVFGHWDTRPFADADLAHPNAPMDGASDGASAVAVALELARVLSQQPDSFAPSVGVDFIFFDAEDWGYDQQTQAELPNQLAGSPTDSWCLGSQYWATHLVPTNYKPTYGVLLDMVGAKGAASRARASPVPTPAARWTRSGIRLTGWAIPIISATIRRPPSRMTTSTPIRRAFPPWIFTTTSRWTTCFRPTTTPRAIT